MTELAIGTWVATAFIGAYMWSFTADSGRPESNARATRLSPLMLFVHPLLGLTGFTAWLAFVYSDIPELAWVALGFLLLGAVIGDVLTVRTVRGGDEASAVPGQAVADRTYAESRIPRIAIMTHGVLALSTIGLVLGGALTA